MDPEHSDNQRTDSKESENQRTDSKESEQTKLIISNDEKNNIIHSIYHPPTIRRIIVLSQSQAGKTVTVVPDLLRTLRQPMKLIIISPNFSQPTYCQIRKQMIEKRIPVELTDDLNAALEQETPPQGEHNIVIIDDFFGKDLKHPAITRLFTESTHLGSSVILLTQSWFDLPRYVRDNCNTFIVLRYPYMHQVFNHYLRGMKGIPNNLGSFMKLFEQMTDIGSPEDKDHRNYMTICTDPYVNPFYALRKNLDGTPLSLLRNIGANIFNQ